MSTSPNEDVSVAGYVEAARDEAADVYAVKIEELAWMLRDSFESNTLRLKLLTALQRALPRSADEEDGPAGELKGLLTNVIIMQTRLNEREADLAGLLEQAAEAVLVKPVEIDPDVVRRLVESIEQAYRRLQVLAHDVV